MIPPGEYNTPAAINIFTAPALGEFVVETITKLQKRANSRLQKVERANRFLARLSVCSVEVSASLPLDKLFEGLA